MESKYTLWVVVDGFSYQVALDSDYLEKEAQTAMETFKQMEKGWLGLENGDMLSLNSNACNFYFICKKVI